MAVEAVSLPAATVEDYSDAARTVQFDVHGLLNARAVTILSNQKLVPWNKGIDGISSGLATRAAADAMGSTGKVALPDDGIFPANAVHPLVQLNFSNADPAGNQVRYTDRNTPDSYSLAVAEDFYSNLSLFFMSAFGASEISVEIAYSDRTTEVKAYSVEDWAMKVRETETKYFLSANLAKWGPKNTELEKDNHYLIGINLQPAPTKKVAKVTLHKPASGTSLVFWGATGCKAQCHIIAYAGRGVMRDWQGVRAVRCAPEYYEYALPDDPATRWDPIKYVPDAIGVCLGNNDFSEGVPDQTEYVRLYADFVRKLRRDAPEARIFLIPSPTLADEPGRVPLRSVQRAYLEEVSWRLGDPGVQVRRMDIHKRTSASR